MKEWVISNPALHKKYKELRAVKNRSNERRLIASLKQKDYVARTENFSEISSKRMKKFYENNPAKKEQISRSLGGAAIEVYKDGVYVVTFPTLAEAGRKLGISTGNIGMVLKGVRNYAGGFTFKRKFT